MSTITTAAELDALPIGSVVLDSTRDAWLRDDKAWVCVGASFDAGYIVKHYAPLTVLYRPDAEPEPQRVQPSREDVADAILAKHYEPALLVYSPARFHWLAVADAVLALFAAQPTVAEVRAEALREAADELDRLVYVVGNQPNQRHDPDGDAYWSWANKRDLIADENERTDAQWLRARADREAGGEKR